MKGLLLKDFYNLRGFGPTLLAILALYAVISLLTGNIAMLTSLLLIFCAMLPMSVTTIDEQAKFSAYAQCMPLSRRMVVRAKYLFACILLLAAFVLVMLFTALTAAFHPLNWTETLVTDGIILCMVLITNAVITPIIYKVGVEKARLFTILVFVVLMLPFLLLAGYADALAGVPQWVYGLIPVLAVGLFAASYFVSVRIYEGKEL